MATDIVNDAVRANETLKRIVDWIVVYGPKIPQTISDDIREVGLFIEARILED